MKLNQIVIALLLIASSGAFTKSRFKSVKCVSLNETVVEIRYCYLKAYSRTYVSFNYGETRKLSLEKPVEVSEFWELSKQILVKWISDQRVNQVSLRNNFPRNSSNRVWSLQHLRWGGQSYWKGFFCPSEGHCIRSFKKMSTTCREFGPCNTFTAKIFDCLFKEEVDMKNITLSDNDWPSIIPSGVYRTEITFKGVMKLQIESTFSSDIKTSFWKIKKIYQLKNLVTNNLEALRIPDKIKSKNPNRNWPMFWYHNLGLGKLFVDAVE